MTTSTIRTTFVLLLLVVFGPGCSISKHVNPVPVGTKIHTIYIVENQDTLYKESLLEELQTIINDTGCQAVPVTDAQAPGMGCCLRYQANWQWDLAMYLIYFKATLYDQSQPIGEVEYDARMGGGRLDKFGSTAGKIRPLLQEMLAGVDHSTAASTNSTAEPATSSE